jgi:hypothetical protein
MDRDPVQTASRPTRRAAHRRTRRSTSLSVAVIVSVLTLVPAMGAAANSSIGSLDCDGNGSSIWRDSVGPVFGQGHGSGYSFSAGGLCYSHLTTGTASQRVRLATTASNGYTGIPLAAIEPEITFDVSTNVDPTSAVGSAQFVYVALRKEYASKTSSGHEYRARLAFSSGTSAGRNVRLSFSKVVSHVESRIGSNLYVPSTVAFFQPNNVLHVKVALTGTSPTVLRAKVWAAGTTEPSQWQLTATDDDPALQQSGRIELLTKVSASNVALPMDFMFDDFTFVDAN